MGDSGLVRRRSWTRWSARWRLAARRLILIGSAATIAVLVTTVGVPGVAQAQIRGRGETIYSLDTPYFHGEPSYLHDVASGEFLFYQTVMNPGTGGQFTLGIRTSSGIQNAKGVTGAGNIGYWTAMLTSSGSRNIAGGRYWLNSRVTGACGGSGCGPVHWEALVSYGQP